MKLLLLFVVLAVLSTAFGSYIESSVWPKPAVFSKGASVVPVATFEFKTLGLSESDSTVPITLSAAYSRYNSMIFNHKSKTGDDNIARVAKVNVAVDDYSEAYPQLETDESYTLDIPAESTGEIYITAKTVYGALRGIESLSQLVVFDMDVKGFVISESPIHIEDKPRYAHRGLLLDTSRHFEPISSLKSTIDALSYAKFNVLHWHVVDTQSFPFESSTYPRLWMGSYSKNERYTQEDIQELVEYGRMRGVKIMIEFDMPGHAASWCAGYPEICPSMNCKQPLNPASNLTFPLITSLLTECTGNKVGGGLFPYSLLHLGGDEVSYSCWETSASIKAWETENGLSGSEATYEYFVDKAAGITRNQARTPVQWVEVFEHFGSKLDKNTIVHVWKEKETLNSIVSAGYKALLSNQDSWYLDHLDITWDQMYLNEPTDGLQEGSDPNLIVGGETCMWGETVDPSDVGSTIWPRAAAVSERLWTPKEQIDTVDVATNRLETFRCLLNQRQIAAAPVTNKVGRFAPREPGSCYVQRR